MRLFSNRASGEQQSVPAPPRYKADADLKVA